MPEASGGGTAPTDLWRLMRGTRAIRRLRADPVPDALLEQVLEAGVCAPSRHNRQPWRFVILRSAATRRFFSDAYLGAMHSRYSVPHPRHPRTARQQAAWALAEHLHEAPVILLVCGIREWPERFPPARRSGRAPPPYESLMPCVQNMLLACRALGLGASVTMEHFAFEEALCHYLDIPDEIGIAVALPIGFPAEPFGEVARRPAHEVTHHDRWSFRGRERRRDEPTP